MKKILCTTIFLLFIVFVIESANVTYAYSPEDIVTTIDHLLEEKFAEQNIPNGVVSVVYEGEVIFEKGYGYHNIAMQTPINPESSLFRIGSISKLMTWTAVMQLVEQGKLDLDEDVNKYLNFTIPDYKDSEPITLRHLLTHTPGFEDYSNKIFTIEQEKFPSLHNYVRELLPERIFPAGEVLAYSNYGTALAGYIVERVSGMPYDTYVEQNIFSKLAMKHSTFQQPLPEELIEHGVTPYRYVDGDFKEAKFEYMPTPAGGMSSSASDMANFMLAFLQGGKFENETILKEDTVNEMLAQQFTHHPELNGMTFGFIEGDTNGKRVLMHGGSTMLFNSMLYLLPEEKLGIFMSYSGGSHLIHNEVLHAFMDKFYPQEIVNETQINNVSPNNLKKYAGEYQQNRKSVTTDDKFTSLLFGVIRVKVSKDGHLLVTHMGETYPFYEVENGIFKTERTKRSPDPYGNFKTLVFKENQNGQMLLILDGPMTYTKASWYETSSLTFMSLGVALIFIIGTLLSWVIIGMVRLIRKNVSQNSTNKIAKIIGMVYGLLMLILVMNIIIDGEIDPVYQLSKDAYNMGSDNSLFLNIFSYVFVIVTLGLVVATVWLWMRKSGKILSRVHYTLYTGTALFFAWIFYFWNLY